jgi:glyoxylase-like metal-dependent hydrolase (beta-lactamase superfamily II)
LYDPPSRSFTYLLGDLGQHEAVAVDPGPPGVLLPLLGLVDELGLRLTHLLCTHFHDGIPAAMEELRHRTGAKIVAGAANGTIADRPVCDGDVVVFGNEVVRVLETPGHTIGDVSYLWRDRVFTGDTLQVRGCGRTDLPGGDAGALYDSITHRLLVLPGDTLLYPRHETDHRSVSTIAEERDHNPCVAGQSRDEFITQRCAG